jgi:hypothetical protein
MDELVGLAYFTLIFFAIGIVTSACLKRRIDDLIIALEDTDKKYVY